MRNPRCSIFFAIICLMIVNVLVSAAQPASPASTANTRLMRRIVHSGQAELTLASSSEALFGRSPRQGAPPNEDAAAGLALNTFFSASGVVDSTVEPVHHERGMIGRKKSPTRAITMTADGRLFAETVEQTDAQSPTVALPPNSATDSTVFAVVSSPSANGIAQPADAPAVGSTDAQSPTLALAMDRPAMPTDTTGQALLQQATPTTGTTQEARSAPQRGGSVLASTPRSTIEQAGSMEGVEEGSLLARADEFRHGAARGERARSSRVARGRVSHTALEQAQKEGARSGAISIISGAGAGGVGAMEGLQLLLPGTTLAPAAGATTPLPLVTAAPGTTLAPAAGATTPLPVVTVAPGTTLAPAAGATTPLPVVTVAPGTTLAPAAGATTPADSTTATGAEATGDGKGKKIILLCIFAAGLIVIMCCTVRFARGSVQKQHQYGRLNEIAQDDQDATKAWTNQKARQTYRKSQLKQGQGGAGTDSEEDPNALLAAATPEASNSDRVVRVDPVSSSSHTVTPRSARSPTHGGTSYRDRRSQAAEARQTTPPPVAGFGAGEVSASETVSSYRHRRSQAARSPTPPTEEAAAPTRSRAADASYRSSPSYRDRRGEAAKQEATGEQTEI